LKERISSKLSLFQREENHVIL